MCLTGSACGSQHDGRWSTSSVQPNSAQWAAQIHNMDPDQTVEPVVTVVRCVGTQNHMLASTCKYQPCWHV